MHHETDQLDRIAVIGMAGRFPGAPDLDHFWKNLSSGVESVTAFTEEQLLAAGADPRQVEAPNYVKSGVVLDGVEFFDAGLFGYSPRDAELMDPQHRLFLECSWAALEDAGYDPDRTRLRVGVYAGTGTNSYLRNNLISHASLMSSLNYLEKLMAADNDYLSTRVAYKLNLKGPSLTVQTACSTSLVAIHLACQSLLNGECDIALAGGVLIKIPQVAGYLYQEGSTLSPDGRCRAFDASAHGMMPGSGAGVVVLKRLAEALEDGDCIRAVVRGSAINNDGAGRAGYTAPSVEGQAKVIAEALALAAVSADEVSYVEAHGTGTALGDPIEVAALTEAFRRTSQTSGFCAIGSVKTNIGHLGAAAGVAGLLKVILALQNRCLPPSLNFLRPNPAIDFANGPFYVQQTLSEWRSPTGRRIAGVSSFGIGGTNAHVVLEEAPVAKASGPSRPWQLLLLSAHTAAALDAMTKNLGQYLKRHPEVNLADIAFTLQRGRKSLACRRMLVCQSTEDAIAALDPLDLRRVSSHRGEAIPKDVVFMFPGQGAQYPGMSLDLYRTETEFRQQVDRCCEFLKPRLSLDLRDVLFPSEEKAASASQKLEQTEFAQPAIFVVEYALARLLISWGIKPTALVGHSIGEYVAACLAGVFSLEDALALVANRGRLMQSLPTGSMLAVSAAETDVRPLLAEDLSVAAVNSPSLCVVSGEANSVKALEMKLNRRGINTRHLHTSHAFHSKMMDPIVGDFARKAEQSTFGSPEIPIVSTVTGTWASPSEMTTPTYWTKNLRQTVRFSNAVQELLKEPDRILLEVGPGNTLATCVRQHMNGSDKRLVLSTIRHPQERTSDLAFLLNTLGRLWLAGVEPDWDALYKHEHRCRLALPTYPFEKQRYWIEPSKRSSSDGVGRRAEDKPAIDEWFYVPCWKRADLPENGHCCAHSSIDSCALLFLDEQGFGIKFGRLLQENGQRVIVVRPGAHFQRVSEDSFVINSAAKEDYHALWAALAASNRLPNAIVHFWCLTGDESKLSDVESYELFRTIGFNSLLFLTQAISAQSPGWPVQIKVVSNQLHEVTGEEALSPEKAIVLGPCRVVSQEHLNIRCAAIDVGDRPTDLYARLLMKELAVKTDHIAIAYRGTHRWVQTLEQTVLPKIRLQALPLQEDGVYLITGGLAGVGLVLAEHLASLKRTKLVLLSRTGLPNREEWPEWLGKHGDNDDVSRRIRNVQAIEARGSQVTVIQADVADVEQMRAALDSIRSSVGAINGVIHAAGIRGDRMTMIRKETEAAASVMSPKVLGTMVLGELLRRSRPDFFVLCSSLSVQLGGIGNVDYCAANAFLDNYAHKYHSEMNVISVNWSGWQGIGMGVTAQVPAYLKEKTEQSLKSGVLPEEGSEAFDRILGSAHSQAIVSPQQLIGPPQMSDIAPIAPELPTVEEASHPRPDLSSEYIAPGNSTEENIAEIWRKLLGMANVGIHDNFFELGGSSLLAPGLVGQMNSAFHIDLPVATLFENPTVHSLSQAVLEGEHKGRSLDESKKRGQQRRERIRR